MSSEMGSKGGPFERLSRRLVEAALAAACLTVLAASPVLAQGQYTFSERNMKKMIKVVGLLEEGKTEEAKEILNGINLNRAKPYGRARIHQMLGTLAAQDEEYEAALEHLEACIAEEALQPEEQLRSLYLVGQLQTMLERYRQSLHIPLYPEFDKIWF